MGAGGSAQADVTARASPGRQGAAPVAGAKAPPSSVTTMKKRAVPPLPTEFAVTAFDPLVHKQLAAKGVGVVVNMEELRTSTGTLPVPPNMSAAVVNTLLRASERGQCGASTGEGGPSYRWFAEDLERMGHWEPYNSESSQRLENAFMERKESCLVTLRKRAYTVNLTTMQQLPEGVSTLPVAATARARRVMRAPATVQLNAKTGEETVQMVHNNVVDPFDDNEGDAAGVSPSPSSPAATASPGEVRPLKDQAAGAFPRLTKLVYPSTEPVYSLDVSPCDRDLSAEARAVGMSGGLDGNMHVISAGKDGKMVEWNSSTGKVVTRYAITASTPTSVLVARYSPSARFVVCGCDDNDARIYRVGQASPVHMLKGHSHKVYGAAVLAKEISIVTASMDAHIRTWDIETGACTRVEQVHTSNVFAVTASPFNENFCVSGGHDAIVCAHDLRCANSVVMRFKGHSSTVWDCAIFPGVGGENRELASTGIDCTVRLWDPRHPEEAIHVLHHHERPTHSLAYTPNGKGILSCSKDSYVYLCDTATGEAMWRARAQQNSVFRVLYHAEKQTMLTCGASGLVNQWEWPLGSAW